MFCCVVLVVPCQSPMIVINSNAWGRDSGGEWKHNFIIVWRTEAKAKISRLDIWDKWKGLGFWLSIDSFHKYSLNIYYVPGILFSAVGTSGWTRQVRPFLSWRWHGLLRKATFHLHCLDFQLSTILCFRECFFCVSAACLDLPYKQVYFWGTERDYTHSVYKIRGRKSSCRLFKICIKIYKHDWHSSGSSPGKRWSCPQLPNGIKTHIKTVITEKCLKI